MVAGVPSPSPLPTKTGMAKLVKRGTATTMVPPTPYPTAFQNAQDCWNWRSVCYNDVQDCMDIGMVTIVGDANGSKLEV
jgi:hypothetical protein